MVIFCPNIGVLTSSVLALIPLVRPYAWQSLLLPVLPGHGADARLPPGAPLSTLVLSSQQDLALLMSVSPLFCCDGKPDMPHTASGGAVQDTCYVKMGKLQAGVFMLRMGAETM